MTRPIPVAQLRRQLQGRPEAIARMLRVLPILIQEELDHDSRLACGHAVPLPTTDRVVRDLQRRLRMVEQLALEMFPVGHHCRPEEL